MPIERATRPVIVYGASGYTGRLICEYLREYNVPFLAAGRDKASSTPRWPATWPASRPPTTTSSPSTDDVESLTELFKGASVVCNTVGPFSQLGPAVVEACLAAGVHYTRHHRRAGLADHLRRAVRRRLRRRRPAALPRHRADVHHGRDRRPAVPGEARPGHPRHRRLLGRQPDHRLDARRSWSTPRSSQAHYLEQNTYQPWDPEAGLYQLVHPRPARARPRRCPGAAPPTRCGSSKRPARGQREGAGRRLQPSR